MTKIPAALLSREEVERRTSLTRGAIYARLREGAFPAPVKLGARQRAWVEAEIEAWILERAAERDDLAAVGFATTADEFAAANRRTG